MLLSHFKSVKFRNSIAFWDIWHKPISISTSAFVAIHVSKNHWPFQRCQWWAAKPFIQWQAMVQLYKNHQLLWQKPLIDHSIVLNMLPLLWSIQPTAAVAPGVGEGTRRKRRKGRVAARQGASSRLRGGFKSRRFYSHKLITCLPVDCQLEGATPGNKELANPAPWNESDVSNWFAECVVARRKIAILRPSLVHHIFQAQCFALSGGVHAILRMHMFCGTLLLKYILNV